MDSKLPVMAKILFQEKQSPRFTIEMIILKFCFNLESHFKKILVYENFFNHASFSFCTTHCSLDIKYI